MLTHMFSRSADHGVPRNTPDVEWLQLSAKINRIDYITIDTYVGILLEIYGLSKKEYLAQQMIRLSGEIDTFNFQHPFKRVTGRQVVNV